MWHQVPLCCMFLPWAPMGQNTIWEKYVQRTIKSNEIKVEMYNHLSISPQTLRGMTNNISKVTSSSISSRDGVNMFKCETENWK